jgi:hypothetical protein
MALHNAKLDIPKTKDTLFKITENMDEDQVYIQLLNKIIIQYRIIEVVKCKERFKLKSSISTVYAVVQLNDYNGIFDYDENEAEAVDEMICNNYYHSIMNMIIMMMRRRIKVYIWCNW